MTSQPDPAPGQPGSSDPDARGGPDLTSPDAAGRTSTTDGAPPDTNQARTERMRDSDIPASGTPSAANPQSPSLARVQHEADRPEGLAPLEDLSSVAGTGRREQTQAPGPGDSKGVDVPHRDPALGSSEDLASVQTGATADQASPVPVEAGHQTGGVTGQTTVGAHRGSAPDGEVSPD